MATNDRTNDRPILTTGGGEPLADAFDKINENFDDLFSIASNFSAVNRNIIPDATETYDIGNAVSRFRDIYLSGNTIHLGNKNISVNEQGELEFGGTKIPTQTDLDSTIAATSSGPLTGTLTGDVYATDSTLLVDAQNGKIVGPVEANVTGNLDASLVEATTITAQGGSSNDTGGSVNLVGANGAFQGGGVTVAGAIGVSGDGGNVNIAGGIGSSGDGGNVSFVGGTGTIAGGDAIIAGGAGDTNGGNVFINAGPSAGTDGKIFVNGDVTFVNNKTIDFTNANVTGLEFTLDGELKGSVFADDSTLLVDGVNGKIVAPININDNEIFDGAGDTGLNIRSNQTDGNIYLYSYGSDGDGTGAGNIYVTGNGVDIYSDWRNGGVDEYKWSFGGDGTLTVPGNGKIASPATGNLEFDVGRDNGGAFIVTAWEDRNDPEGGWKQILWGYDGSKYDFFVGGDITSQGTINTTNISHPSNDGLGLRLNSTDQSTLMVAKQSFDRTFDEDFTGYTFSILNTPNRVRVTFDANSGLYFKGLIERWTTLYENIRLDDPYSFEFDYSNIRLSLEPDTYDIVTNVVDVAQVEELIWDIEIDQDPIAVLAAAGAVPGEISQIALRYDYNNTAGFDIGRNRYGMSVDHDDIDLRAGRDIDLDAVDDFRVRAGSAFSLNLERNDDQAPDEGIVINLWNNANTALEDVKSWVFGFDGTLRLPASSIGGGIGLIYSPADKSLWLSGTNVDKSTDGNGVVLNGGQNAGTGRGGGISLFGGNSTGGTGGSIFIETGIGQGGADNGVISIGTAYAKTITIGNANQSSNEFYGTLYGNVAGEVVAPTGSQFSVSEDYFGNTTDNGGASGISLTDTSLNQTIQAGWTAEFTTGGTYTVQSVSLIGDRLFISMNDGTGFLGTLPVTFTSPDYSAGSADPVTITANSNDWVFGTDGTTTFPGSITVSDNIDITGGGRIDLDTDSNFYITNTDISTYGLKVAYTSELVDVRIASNLSGGTVDTPATLNINGDVDFGNAGTIDFTGATITGLTDISTATDDITLDAGAAATITLEASGSGVSIVSGDGVNINNSGVGTINIGHSTNQTNFAGTVDFSSATIDSLAATSFENTTGGTTITMPYEDYVGSLKLKISNLVNDAYVALAGSGVDTIVVPDATGITTDWKVIDNGTAYDITNVFGNTLTVPGVTFLVGFPYDLFDSTTADPTDFREVTIDRAGNIEGLNSIKGLDNIVSPAEDQAFSIYAKSSFGSTNMVSYQYSSTEGSIATYRLKHDFSGSSTRMIAPNAVPSTSNGQSGDKQGYVAFDGSYIYYCTADYTDGVADIWKRVAWSGDTW